MLPDLEETYRAPEWMLGAEISKMYIFRAITSPKAVHARMVVLAVADCMAVSSTIVREV